jgi:hypothetical protein
MNVGTVAKKLFAVKPHVSFHDKQVFGEDGDIVYVFSYNCTTRSMK